MAASLAPLYALRLRTLRLELRVPTHDDLLELFAVAEAGIHPPAEMPFAVAWTDTLRLEAFLEFHEAAFATWTPGWDCNFVTLRDGRVIGTQTLHGKEFATKRTVGSGSWLGRAHQGLGYGTEQRAAVLELAFRGLDAVAAETGALLDNHASQRVSEKLGYRRVGTSSIAPRGVPVPHFDYRLEREQWRSPIPVALEELEPCLPLFGLAAG